MHEQTKYQHPFTNRMSLILKGEEVMLTVISIYLLAQHALGWSVWTWILLFFSPDLAVLGYLSGNRMGAFTYNLAHNRGIAIVLAMAGYLIYIEPLLTSGLLLFAHSSFDRMLGFGLKYRHSFNSTHLGMLGRNKQANV